MERECSDLDSESGSGSDFDSKHSSTEEQSAVSEPWTHCEELKMIGKPALFDKQELYHEEEQRCSYGQLQAEVQQQ